MPPARIMRDTKETIGPGCWSDMGADVKRGVWRDRELLEWKGLMTYLLSSY
jgi:hypothetical protein